MVRELNIKPDDMDELKVPDKISGDIFESMRYIESANDEADYAGDFEDDDNIISHEMSEEDIDNTSEYIGKPVEDEHEKKDDQIASDKKTVSNYSDNYTLEEYRKKKTNEIIEFFKENNESQARAKEYGMATANVINSSAAMGISFDKMDMYINCKYSYRQMDLLKTSILLAPDMSIFNQIKDSTPENMIKLINICIGEKAAKDLEKELNDEYIKSIDELQAKIDDYKKTIEKMIEEHEIEILKVEEGYKAEIDSLKKQLAEQDEDNKKAFGMKEETVSINQNALVEVIENMMSQKEEIDKKRFSLLYGAITSNSKTESNESNDNVVREDTDERKNKKNPEQRSDDETEDSIKKDDEKAAFQKESKLKKILLGQKKDFNITDYALKKDLDANQIHVITVALAMGIDEEFLKKIIDRKESTEIMMERLRMYSTEKRKDMIEEDKDNSDRDNSAASKV